MSNAAQVSRCTGAADPSPDPAPQTELWAGKQGASGGDRKRPSGPARLKLTKCAALREMMSNGEWWSMGALQAVAGWRYSARLNDIKTGRDGSPPMDYESRRYPDGCWWYRIKGER